MRLLLPIIAIGLLGSCSAKKNTAATRKYQAFITRYNIYYNGDEHYKETLKEMEKKYNDDYTSLLYPHPAEAKANPKSPQPSGDFTRSIEKAQKAIQLRSIKKRPKRKSGKVSEEYKKWLKREEFNPFLHNAWMMMGRSQYLNGDFAGAAATFFYISRHFSWLPQTVTEAQLWQVRSYVAFDWVNEAEAIFKRIKPDQLTNGTLRELYDFVEADIAVKRKDYAAAIPALQRAVKGASGAQKTRLQYLLGQCLAREGRREEAFKAFKAAAEGGGTTYRTKLNARIAQSEVYSGKDITPEVKALKRMAGLDRNKKYLDQIYYAIGNLYLSRGDTLHAIENYILASEKSERNGIEKAINDVTLGQLYYEQGKYDLAQPPLSSAVPQLPETYPGYQLLKRRSDVLDELSIYAHNVALQDSLLRLSEKPEEEQLKIINKIIDELKKKEKEEEEEARRAEHEAESSAHSNANSGPNAPTQFQMGSTDDSWYFYNSATVASGRTEFQRRWGSRKLEDDWRRRNKASFSFSDFDSDSSETEEGENPENAGEGENKPTPEEQEKAERANDPHYPEYYLAQIPKTEQDKQTAHEVIQEGLYTMGSILNDKLEDFGSARKEWGRLLEDYPDNIYRLDVYYNLYIMLMRMGQTAEAEQWRRKIISDFPDSKYGVALLDPDYIQRLREMPEAQRMMYEQAYEAYLANNNAQVHHSYQEMMKKYPVSEAMPKFMFLHALAYVTEKKPEEFNTTLRELLERYPDTDLTPMASAFLKGMAQGRKLNEGVSNNRSMLWDIRLSSAGAEGEEGSGEGAGEAEFVFLDDEPQYIALVYPTDQVNANELLYNVARHNFNSFMVRDYDLEQLTFGQLGMLLIKFFDNVEDAENYRTMLGRSEIMTLPEAVTPIIISVHNFDQLISSGSTFEQYFQAAAEALAPDDAPDVEDNETDDASAPEDPEETPAQEADDN